MNLTKTVQRTIRNKIISESTYMKKALEIRKNLINELISCNIRYLTKEEKEIYDTNPELLNYRKFSAFLDSFPLTGEYQAQTNAIDKDLKITTCKYWWGGNDYHPREVFHITWSATCTDTVVFGDKILHTFHNWEDLKNNISEEDYNTIITLLKDLLETVNYLEKKVSLFQKILESSNFSLLDLKKYSTKLYKIVKEIKEKY